MSRIRANQITNQAADGAPTVQHGLIIAGVSTFTGSVSIGGTLTYEDVTNIDSVGLITARAGVNVSGGQLDVGSNIKLGNAGVITATSIVSTIGTFTGDTAISGSLQIADTIQHEGDVNTKLRFPAADTITAETAGSERLRITSTGNIGIAGATGTDFSLLDGMVINTANGSAGLLINSSSSSHNAYLGFSYGSGSSTSHNDQYSAYIGRVGDNTLVFGTNNSIRAQVTSDGHVVPGANNLYDLGSTSLGWRNVYMNDLNLSNMKGDKNDVDGTQGSWTIQEGKDDLYIINRLNGKKFKIKMEEIS